MAFAWWCTDWKVLLLVRVLSGNRQQNPCKYISGVLNLSRMLLEMLVLLRTTEHNYNSILYSKPGSFFVSLSVFHWLYVCKHVYPSACGNPSHNADNGKKQTFYIRSNRLVLGGDCSTIVQHVGKDFKPISQTNPFGMCLKETKKSK